MVKDVEDWPYSSFSDYARIRDGNLYNKVRATELLEITDLDIKIGPTKKIGDEMIKKIYL